MLLITCPHCGPRDENEFSYGGARRIWPDHDANLDQTETAMQDWHQTLYLSPNPPNPSNPSGPLTEIWYHGGGCECWVEIIRNTKDHSISNRQKGRAS